jgi:photosystem II stability/assembly factor-like uncharacterized protein
MIVLKRIVTAIAFLALSTPLAKGQDQPSAAWNTPDLSFRALNITSNGRLLWVCGTDESIAVSEDEGVHWKVKHQMLGSGLLLNIDFADAKFGYAAGTGGLLFTTIDGGETWIKQPGLHETILQVSFSDPQTGLARTTASLLFTTDGGEHWSAVSEGQNADDIKNFPYSFSLVSLDTSRMAIMLKQGAAQYVAQAFLSTQDAGRSWKFVNIPNVTLYSFLRVKGKYWAVGSEVIHKEQKNGGYAVPVALNSSDGVTWTHSDANLTACKGEECTVCNPEGCFSTNGAIARIFLEKTSYSGFPTNKELTPKWASTDSTICFVGAHLQCTGLKSLSQTPVSSGVPAPTVVGPGRLGTPASSGANCIICGLDRIFIDKQAQGTFTIKLVITTAQNGTVSGVEVQGAPTPEITSKIEQQTMQWVFEPYLKDGVPVKLKVDTSTSITVIKPR